MHLYYCGKDRLSPTGWSGTGTDQYVTRMNEYHSTISQLFLI